MNEKHLHSILTLFHVFLKQKQTMVCLYSWGCVIYGGVTMRQMSKRILQMIEGMKVRDEKSFNVFYDSYYRLIYYVVYPIVTNKEDAEEITNDVCMKIYDKINTFKGGNFESWLYTIAKHTAINFYHRVQKKQKRIVKNDDYVHTLSDAQSSVTPLYVFLKESFNEETVDIIIYHTVYDFSFKKIASLMGLSKSYAYRCYQDALPKLIQLMEGYDEKN